MPHLTLETGLGLLRKKAYETVHTKSIENLKANVRAPMPYFFLGVIASDHNNHNKALELYDKAIELNPNVPTFSIYKAITLSLLGQQSAAKKIADKAAEYDQSDPFMLDSLGVVYSRSGYHRLAIPYFEKAVLAAPKVANFHYNLAASAQFIGDFEKAKKSYETTLRLNRNHYRAWSSLVSINKQMKDDNNLDALKTLFQDTKNQAEARLHLGHAIAKTLEDLGRYEDSLDWLLLGKKTQRAQLRYDRVAGNEIFEAAKSTSPASALPLNDTSKSSPIFIFGLPRTGTTLVDRILSSHADVVSAGELNIFSELVKEMAQTPSNLVMSADVFNKIKDLELADIGKRYIAATKDRAVGTRYMIDKMPLNFFYAGLIHRALPDARIIALRRGAMDSCLSNFRQLFSTQYSYYNYTFDLEDTAWFYRKFDSLMSHWRETLPKTRFMEIHYEVFNGCFANIIAANNARCFINNFTRINQAAFAVNRVFK